MSDTLHAFTPYANAERNQACARCGRPKSSPIHRAEQKEETIVNAETRYANGYPIKLVRDHIGERLGGEGTITYEPVADDEKHVALLRAKLVEEVVEYLSNPCVSELADVLEVVWSLARVDLRVQPGLVHRRAKTKRIERGGFDRGMVMVGHHEADGRELLPAPIAPTGSSPRERT